MKNLSVEEKKTIGPKANTLKLFIQDEIEKKSASLEDEKYAAIEAEEKIDVTLEFPSKDL